jgi:hypothetical protein
LTIDGESSSAVANGAVDVTRNVSVTGTDVPLDDICVVIMRGEVLVLAGVELIGSRK